MGNMMLFSQCSTYHGTCHLFIFWTELVCKGTCILYSNWWDANNKTTAGKHWSNIIAVLKRNWSTIWGCAVCIHNCSSKTIQIMLSSVKRKSDNVLSGASPVCLGVASSDTACRLGKTTRWLRWSSIWIHGSGSVLAYCSTRPWGPWGSKNACRSRLSLKTKTLRWFHVSSGTSWISSNTLFPRHIVQRHPTPPAIPQ